VTSDGKEVGGGGGNFLGSGRIISVKSSGVSPPKEKASQVWQINGLVICSFAGFYRPQEGRYPEVLNES
jgi:hypothetical protein